MKHKRNFEEARNIAEARCYQAYKRWCAAHDVIWSEPSNMSHISGNADGSQWLVTFVNVRGGLARYRFENNRANRLPD